MNQDAVKNILLSIEDAPLDFSLIFSGKKSRKVNGLYKPQGREIIIHNKNFLDASGVQNENSLIYTAIHEYAHHLHACKHGGKLPSRAHTREFWSIFHALLGKAEELELYKTNLAASPALAELTSRIKENFLTENGRLLKDLGRSLIEAQGLCAGIGMRFEDYTDRILCMPRISAKMAVKMFQYDIKPEIGPDNMRFVAGISGEDARSEVQKAFLSGKSPDTVITSYKNSRAPADDEPRLQLEKEKLRIERTIGALTKRLDEVEHELEEL
jgi:hypothetical protein